MYTRCCFRHFRALGFCKIYYCLFDEQKNFLSNIFYEHGYNFCEHYRRHVEIFIEKEENENTRKKNKHYAEHLSANMKQVVSLEMDPFNEVTKVCRLPCLQRCFTAVNKLGEHSMCMLPPILQQSPI